MKRTMLACCFLSLALQAQEELDTSIFDGTGRELEKVEPREPAPGSPEAETESAEAGEAGGPSVDSEIETPVPAESDEMPREIVLPGGEEAEALEETAAGIPAASGGSKSRAGETVESTEKIPTGQAVDFPWDM
ncbi:hypothetical protein P0Y35_03145 [Kiritimatiellaeota bacterium B1221]|nr:hypothetical protein [Kiritimatiellaeota bacterium B1221]